ncbi:hypothetical protein PENTCL1PPCAC_15888, partial [Pristionchus entomophagus]
AKCRWVLPKGADSSAEKGKYWKDGREVDETGRKLLMSGEEESMDEDTNRQENDQSQSTPKKEAGIGAGRGRRSVMARKKIAVKQQQSDSEEECAPSTSVKRDRKERKRSDDEEEEERPRRKGGRKAAKGEGVEEQKRGRKRKLVVDDDDDEEERSDDEEEEGPRRTRGRKLAKGKVWVEPNWRKLPADKILTVVQFESDGTYSAENTDMIRRGCWLENRELVAGKGILLKWGKHGKVYRAAIIGFAADADAAPDVMERDNWAKQGNASEDYEEHKAEWKRGEGGRGEEKEGGRRGEEKECEEE